MATHSSILAWRIPWTEEPGRLQSMGSKESDTTQRLKHHHQTYISIQLKMERNDSYTILRMFIQSLSPNSTNSLTIDTLHQCGTFVTIDQPILILYYEIKSIAYNRVHILCLESMSFDKLITSCVCNYGIIQNSFTALRSPILHLFLLCSFSLNPWQLLIFLLS